MRIREYLKRVATAILVFATTFCQAEPICEDKGFVFGALSYHFWDRDEEDYNETNETIGFYCDDWTFARFNNSYNEEAWLVGKEVKHFNYKSLDTSLEVGLAFGYDKVAGEKYKGVIPIYSFKFHKPITERVNTVLRLNHEVAALSFEYRL